MRPRDPAKRLLLIGTSYKQAPVELRERLHVVPHESAALTVPLAGKGEAAILATCNRVEIYLADADLETGRARVVSELARRSGLAADELTPILHAAEGTSVAQHLFRVAAGLESLALGEPQILGQIREAQRLAADANAAGPMLNRLFGHALHAGKRVRTETQIAPSANSIADAAIRLVRRRLGTLRGRRIVIIGAGKLGELAATGLSSAGARGVVVSRRLESDATLARRFGGRAIGFDQLGAEVEEADAVISCTRGPGPVLEAEQVAAALPQRSGTRLLLVDLAVPRNLDPTIATLPGCELYDIDDVGSGSGAQTTLAELRQAGSIVAEEVTRFDAWQRALGVTPEIAALRRRAEEIRATELARATGKLARLSPEERRAVEVMTAQIVNKLLLLPTVRVKEAADDARFAATLRHLFALEDVA